MWRINKQFIDEQKALNKDFYFSYEPWIVQSHESLSKEAWQFDRSVNQATNSCKKNILYQMNVLKQFLK